MTVIYIDTLTNVTYIFTVQLMKSSLLAS